MSLGLLADLNPAVQAEIGSAGLVAPGKQFGFRRDLLSAPVAIAFTVLGHPSHRSQALAGNSNLWRGAPAYNNGMRSLSLAATIVLLSAATGQIASRPSLGEPAISPNKREIAFVSGGDIWSVPAAGGEARLLVSHPANESLPRWSPDGRELAFVSTRTGNGDIYVLTLDSGQLRRITFDDVADQLNGWSPDGRFLYFHSSSRDIAGMNDIFRVPAQGGTPMQVAADQFANEFFSAPSPKGDAIAFSARGNAAGQWWRQGRSHLDRAEIWLRRDSGEYQRVSGGDVRELWPMWSGDAQSLYFVSDRSGTENLWEAPVLGRRAARQLTQFKDGRVLWPTASADGKLIVFERDFRIWKHDLTAGRTEPVEVQLRGAPAAPAVSRVTLNNQFGELTLSPDGRKIAFTAMGEVWAASSRDGGSAFRVTRSAALESRPVWSADSKKLIYVSNREGVYRLYEYDFSTEAEKRLTNDPAGDHSPSVSPDGKHIAFIRGRTEIRLLDTATGAERSLAQGYFGRPPFTGAAAAWSADSQWLAFLNAGERGYRNAYAVPVSDGAPTQLSFLPNSFAGVIAWHPDSNRVLFTTSQRTETSYIARVDLVPITPRFREDQFRELFKDTAPARPSAQAPAQAPPAEAVKPAPAKPQPKPVKIQADGIRDRIELLRTGIDVNSFSISPDGKTLLIAGEAAGQVNLYTYSIDELARETPVARQLTSTAGFKSNAQFAPEGKEVYFLESGRVQIVNVDTRQVRPLNLTVEIEMDYDQVKREVFSQAWTYLNDNFYDPGMHGTDWKTQRERFAPLVEGARTPQELTRVLSLMIGTLNASHTGINAPPAGVPPVQTGKLGLRFDRSEYETNGRFRITEVIALSPAAVAGISPGEYLSAIDGQLLNAASNLDALLEAKVNRRVVVTVAADAAGSNRRDVALQPIGTFAEKNLLYRQWVKGRREYVNQVSGGRLGYVHMPDMSQNSLERLYTDLDTTTQSKEGVVIDIRNNNGGFVNAYALDVFARRGYLLMQPRGLPAPNPARTQLGQRALEKPTILVVNQHSLSDAEDFTEGYRTLKLGKVVGEKTAGWIIYTSNVNLIDGSSLRLPTTKVMTLSGENMELVPRPVDVPVERPVGESYTGKDSQLDTAVKELLAQIGEQRPAVKAAGAR
jgi:Tol biopolymer transport system component/C-terminal processing protease CtpA/Prc